MIDFRHFTIAFAIAVTATSAMAQEHGGRSGGERPGHGEQGRQEQSGPGVLSLLPGDSVTEHSIDIPTGKLAYTATAGTFSLFDQSGERSAAVFYTAFIAKPNDTTAGRAPPRRSSTSVSLVRALPHSATAMTAPACIWWTTRIRGSPSPIWF
jgi:uncharacterized protein YdeI (BOF family)